MESLLFLLMFSLGTTAGIWVAKRNKLQPKFYAIIAGVGVAVVAAGYGGVMFHNRMDMEVWNGEITKKVSEHVSCEHSYSCNCRSDKDGKTTCDTCYEHDYDVNWELENTAGDDIKIRRVDRQGMIPPPRWLSAQVGDAVAQTHRFVNYVMGAKDSLFNTKEQKTLIAQYKSMIPDYPDDVFDYYKINRVLTVGNIQMDDLKRSAWNQQLSLMLRPLGPRKQVNVIIVLTTVQDPNFANALRAAWLGGKKNDVVVVVGSSTYPKVDWTRVFSWSDNEAFKIGLADAIQDKGALDPVDTTTLIGGWVNRDFSRKHMKGFSYLAWESAPSMGACVLIAIASFLSILGVTYMFLNNTPRRRRYSRY